MDHYFFFVDIIPQILLLIFLIHFSFSRLYLLYPDFPDPPYFFTFPLFAPIRYDLLRYLPVLPDFKHPSFIHIILMLEAVSVCFTHTSSSYFILTGDCLPLFFLFTMVFSFRYSFLIYSGFLIRNMAYTFGYQKYAVFPVLCHTPILV